MEANIEKIRDFIEGINQFNTTPALGAGTTRILFTKEEIKARDYTKALMEKVGLTIEEDAIGNIFGTLEGTKPKLPVVWSGSHIDTVYNAGKFDGMAGVISAIEALRMIKEAGLEHKRSIKALVFTSEEPTRFGLCCLGSRAMAGELVKNDLESIIDSEGHSLGETLASLGYNLDEFDKIIKSKEEVYASIELHIEQGAVLERLGVPIGIVETICAPTNLEVKIKGVQEHAGSTPMPIRCDALVATAEVILAVEELAKDTTSKNTVGTVGRLLVYPNASNAIPGEVTFTIDIRDSVMENKDIILEKIKKLFRELEVARGVTITYELVNHDIPRGCDAGINTILEQVCLEKSVKYNKMVSGAYHDSIFVALFAPTSMIFVPSKAGLSHNPAEHTDYEDIKIGTDILAESLYRLACE